MKREISCTFYFIVHTKGSFFHIRYIYRRQNAFFREARVMLKKRSKDTLKHISQVLWIRKMFKIFKPGSPDNKLGLEECLHLKISANGSGAWLSDRNCTAKFIFACQAVCKEEFHVAK